MMTNVPAIPVMASDSYPASAPDAAAYVRPNVGWAALGTDRRPDCAATMATTCWSTATSPTLNFVSKADSFDPSEMSLQKHKRIS